jgi:hypothetical protein
VERSRHNKQYRPRPDEFEGFLDRICIFHPQGKHKTQNCDRFQGFIDEVLKTAKGGDQKKKPKKPKGDFPEAHNEVNYIYGGPDSYESRRKEKLTPREVLAVSPATRTTLSCLRSPSHSIAATTWTLCQSRGGILSLFAPSSRMSSSTESSSMVAAS